MAFEQGYKEKEREEAAKKKQEEVGAKMSNIKLWDWNKKKKTMIRYLKHGDIFCFQLDESRYCFGRLIAKTLVGYIAVLV